MEHESRVGNLHKSKQFHNAVLLVCLLLATVSFSHASIALLMEEPYGKFGAFNPTGHAAVYFNHVCADSPTVLRSCHDGEYGVVVSRYHKVAGYDWLAIPLIGYLYSVDSLSDIPQSMDMQTARALRDSYRKEHLLKLAPNNRPGGTPKGEWTELVGASFDRTIHGFQVDSTPAQDQRFISIFNNHRNVGHFNLFFHNCADFSRVVLEIYFPNAIQRNFIADAGLMTPKQVARSLVRFGKKNLELNMTAFIIPQLSGSIPRSHPVDGVTESLVKSKKYIVPMVVLAPEVAGGVIAAYLADGRMKLPKATPTFEIGDEETDSRPDQPSGTREALPVSPPKTTPSSTSDNRIDRIQ
jgi:hypothetical protein